MQGAGSPRGITRRQRFVAYDKKLGIPVRSGQALALGEGSWAGRGRAGAGNGLSQTTRGSGSRGGITGMGASKDGAGAEAAGLLPNFAHLIRAVSSKRRGPLGKGTES